MKIETGVMIMKDGKGWGLSFEDGHCTCYGWVDVESADIHNPEFLKRPEDATWKGSHEVAELRKGVIVPVQRLTKVVRIVFSDAEQPLTVS
jgi:hypothetical protein